MSAQRARTNIREAYAALVGEDYDPAGAETDLLAKAHSALHGIELLRVLCEGRTFEEVDPTLCVAAAKTAEGGEAREQLTRLIRDQASWSEASSAAPTALDADQLIGLADARDEALKLTQGDVFRQLYELSESVLSDPSWDDARLCPACDRSGGDSVLDHVRGKIAAFDAAGAASKATAQAWTEKGWNQLDDLEKLGREANEPAMLGAAKAAGSKGNLTGEEARAIAAWVAILSSRADAKAAELALARAELEKSLPENTPMSAIPSIPPRLCCCWAEPRHLVVGLRFEERKLLALYGATYQRYRERVPPLLPIRLS